MVSNGSWKDYGLNISNKQVSFSVFKNAAENAIYNICKNFKPNSKNLKYCITDSRGRILKNSHDLEHAHDSPRWSRGLFSSKVLPKEGFGWAHGRITARPTGSAGSHSVGLGGQIRSVSLQDFAPGAFLALS